MGKGSSTQNIKKTSFFKLKINDYFFSYRCATEPSGDNNHSKILIYTVN